MISDSNQNNNYNTNNHDGVIKKLYRASGVCILNVILKFAFPVHSIQTVRHVWNILGGMRTLWSDGERNEKPHYV